jgi:hypothetical protein
MSNPSKAAFGMLGILLLSASACGGGGVSGNTYVGNGGIVKVEFKSGGKAFFSMGPTTGTCTYSEKGKTVTLVCDGDSTEFTVGDDGALNGPTGDGTGMLGRLTKEKP